VRLRKGTVVIASLIVAVAVGCGSESSGGDSAGSGDDDALTVKLGEQNGSAESGTARLTAEGDKTKVVVELESMSASPVAQPQPAHIHEGSCESLNPTPAYALQDVRDGTSTTTVPVSLEDLRNGDFAINVHKSAAAIKVYVACGDIGESSGAKSDDDDGGYDY
jgi:hypothetical protein